MTANQKSSKALPPTFIVAANEERWVLTAYGITGNVKLRVGNISVVPFAIASIIIVSTERGRWKPCCSVCPMGIRITLSRSESGGIWKFGESWDDCGRRK